jgi:uncharacterized OB-fold protein
MQARQKPLPQPTPETQPFWDGTRQGRLMIMHCNACGHDYFYPRPYCPACFSPNTVWKQASGRAALHTYMIIHRAAPGFEAEAPYVVGIVELEEGPRMMSNIIGVAPDPEALAVDMPLEVTFEQASDQITLPKFRPAR